MLIVCLVRQTCPPRLRSKECRTDHAGTPECAVIAGSREAEAAKAQTDPGYLLQPRPQTTPSTCSTWSSPKSRRATSRPCLKTSFSRGVRSRAVRQRKSMPPTETGTNPEQPNDTWVDKPGEPGIQTPSSLHDFCRTGTGRKPVRTFVSLRISNKRIVRRSLFVGRTINTNNDPLTTDMVEPSGIEPPTSAVRLRRSPS